jgi:DNA-directed RNA polymerase subunit RPC12/RpoP
MILVDYTCTQCSSTHESWTDSPPPTASRCPRCGEVARRRFAGVGLSGRSREPGVPAARGPKPQQLCTKYPQVPGLCHMSASAGRMWVAKYLSDHRAIEAELAVQESRAAVQAPTIADAITHHHFPVSTTPAD